MDFSSSEILRTLLLLFLGGAGTAVTGFLARKKTNAESESTLSKATMDFANTLRDDINVLRERLEKAETQKTELGRSLEDVRTQFEAAELKSKQLQEVLALHDKRASEMKLLISKLSEALSKYEPHNPLLAQLDKM